MQKTGFSKDSSNYLEKLKSIFPNEPIFENATSQLCTYQQMMSPKYEFWLKEIAEEQRFHRKQWEFCFILQVLDQ